MLPNRVRGQYAGPGRRLTLNVRSADDECTYKFGLPQPPHRNDDVAEPAAAAARCRTKARQTARGRWPANRNASSAQAAAAAAAAARHACPTESPEHARPTPAAAARSGCERLYDAIFRPESDADLSRRSDAVDLSLADGPFRGTGVAGTGPLADACDSSPRRRMWQRCRRRWRQQQTGGENGRPAADDPRCPGDQ